MRTKSILSCLMVLVLLICFNSSAVFAEATIEVNLNEEFNLTINQTASITEYSGMKQIKLLDIDPICYPDLSCPTVVPSVKIAYIGTLDVEQHYIIGLDESLSTYGINIQVTKIDTIMDDDGVYATFIISETIPPEEPEPPVAPIFGIYAILGEKFKLQETQPVKIIDYLDENNNPLRIYLLTISEEDQSIKCEVLFGDESRIVKIPIVDSKSAFGAIIEFISVDENWEYATLKVTAEIPPEEPAPVPPKEYCDTSWYYIFKDDAGYNEAYNDLIEPEETFTGTITYDFDEKCKSAILQRCTPYKLDGMSIYTGSKDLEKYKGYEVEIVGKKHSFGLEGYQLEEIWPIKIRCIEQEEIPIAKTFPIEKATAVRVTKALTTLEEVKANTPEQATGIETAQENILGVNTKTGELEQEIKERGMGYKFRWLFGRVAEQEKEDAEFLRSQEQRLTETAELLLQVSEQVGEPAKSVLVDQAESLEEQSEEFLERAEKKEDRAKGLLSMFGL